MKCKRYKGKVEFSFPERCEVGFTIVLPSCLEQILSSEPTAHNSENITRQKLLAKREN